MGTLYKKTIDKRIAKQIRTDLEEFISLMSQKTGLTVDLGNATFTDNDITFKLNLRLVNAPSKELELLIADNKARSKYDFLTEFDLEKITKVGSKFYQLTGYRPRATKKPYQITDQNNNHYIISEEKAEELFGIKDSKSEGNIIQITPPKKFKGGSKWLMMFWFTMGYFI